MDRLEFAPEGAYGNNSFSTNANIQGTTTASYNNNKQANLRGSDFVQPGGYATQPGAYHSTTVHNHRFTNNPAVQENMGAPNVFQHGGLGKYYSSDNMNNTSSSLPDTPSMGGLNDYAARLVDSLNDTSSLLGGEASIGSHDGHPLPNNIMNYTNSVGNMDSTGGFENNQGSNMGNSPKLDIFDSGPSNGLPDWSSYLNPNLIQGTHSTGISAPMPAAPIATMVPTAASISNTPNPGNPNLSIPFVRPAYVELEPNRIDPAGPVTHPSPDFRPVGTNNWTEILHDHSLLQYLSMSNIKEIKEHVTTLGNAHGDDGTATVIDQGPYTTEDAISVWKYCDAYIRRRGQERNNRAARRSRARKEAETLHWKQIALAAGAEDVDFEYDHTDPAYAERGEGAAEILPRETSTAIHQMKAKWTAPGTASVGMQNQLPLPEFSTVGFENPQPTGQPPMGIQASYPGNIPQQTAKQIQHQVYGQALPAIRTPQVNQLRPLSARTRSQTRLNSRRPASAIREPTMSPLTKILEMSPPATAGSSTRNQGQAENHGQGSIGHGNVDFDTYMKQFM